ncbi:MAG: DNRLRE domain-containing protein [Bacteroidota bacterium]
MTVKYNYLRLFILFITIWGLHFCLSAQIQTTISFEASKDNTLYETSDGSLSNGSGNHIFAGKTGVGLARRALLKFDLSSIPSDASVDRVVLEMNVSKSAGATTEVKLIAMRQDWGEGSSDAEGPEGRGITAENGDATWLHRFYPNELWNNIGGDFMPISTASTVISGEGMVSWNDPFMILDVQGWIESPAENFGWLIQGDESQETTANRFDSRESENPPILRITYTIGGDDDDDDNGDDDDDNGDDDDDDNGDDDDDNGDDDDDDNGDDDDDNGDDDDDDDNGDDDDDNGDDDDDDNGDDDDDNGDDDDDDDNGDDDDDNGDDDDDDDNGDDDDDNGDDDDDDSGDDDDDNGDDDGDDDDDNGDDDIAENVAMIQLIHNSSDPIVNAVDIDVNSRMIAQNFSFRSATEFFEVPANQLITFGFAPSSGFGGRRARVEEKVAFEGGKRYVLMVSGVLRTSQFDSSVNGGNIRVNMFMLSTARAKSIGGSGNVDLIAFNGATDAPALDVVMPQIGQTTVDDLSYSNFTEYVSIPAFAGQVQLDVMDSGQNQTFGSFYGDLSQYEGMAITIFSSGFMNPRRNQNGAPFGLFAALPNGQVVPLEGRMGNRSVAVSTVKLKRLVKLRPNPAESWVHIELEDWEDAPLQIQLFDGAGKLVRVDQVDIINGRHQLRWNVINLVKGIYTLRCRQGDRVIAQRLGIQ